jgi:uncharacterized membrane protein YdbT with pleckstrin-like domain
MAVVMPGAPIESLEWRAVGARARRRVWRESLRIGLAFLLPVAFFAPGVALAVLPFLALWAWSYARGSARALGYALAGDRVAARAGWWWRHVSIARYAKVQAIRLDASPFDRRWGMASVAADTAGGGSHRIRIPYLDAEDAGAVFRALVRETGRTAFRW